MNDTTQVTALLAAVGCTDMQAAKVVVVECEPRSKARPRFGSGRVYSDPVQKSNQDELTFFMRQQFRAPLTGNVALACLFFRSSRQPIDTDNMLKQVQDAGTGWCWVDDRQITAVAGVTNLDRERPRVVVAVGPHVSTLNRDDAPLVTCLTCDKPFAGKHLAKSQMGGNIGRFCSPVCRKLSRGADLSAAVNCIGCGGSFKRTAAGTRYCSEACRVNALKNRNAGKRIHPKPVCGTCGNPVSRPEYKTCRACWKK